MSDDVINDVKNAAYDENGLISCDVQPSGMVDYFPYTAGANDRSEFGQMLWQQLIAGKWGEPTPFSVRPEMVEAAREQKRGEINAWRDAQEDASYTFKFNGHSWDYGKASQARLEPVAMLAKSGRLPEDFFWTDAHNHDIPMSANDVIALETAMIGAMVAKGFEIHRHQRELKEALEKLTTVDEIMVFKVF